MEVHGALYINNHLDSYMRPYVISLYALLGDLLKCYMQTKKTYNSVICERINSICKKTIRGISISNPRLRVKRPAYALREVQINYMPGI